MSVQIMNGFPEDQRARAAALFWAAFAPKLHKVMNPETKALAFLHNALRPDHALCAVDETGKLLGLAGFKTKDGALVDGELEDLQQFYGGFGGLWRGLLLGLLERDIEPGVLLMDGICVASDARGMGIGTKLLQAIKSEAQTRKCLNVRLDVISTNPRARELYLREGFKPMGTQKTGPLRLLFGFSEAERMDYAVAQKNPARRDAAN